ncbi:hypothetical protein FA95DRAFT_515657 [Auriscalpium vulgare]|uniref:Uncharacterized protein n=1 Tax=Auriscalpium vulgare TaxID=40419 RepID=A0ACB8RF07_9AGAM|nr:hypothetical protein FA95DRAFT_515657 [Auriscalpium vulgare]
MASVVPPEVIMSIFDMTHPPQGTHGIKANSFLPTVALINKSYLNYARRNLYSEVHLNAPDHGDSCEDTVQKFMETVANTPLLAAMVRYIHYGGGKAVTEDETHALSIAISSCTGLLHLRIFGYDWFAVRNVSQSIMTRPNLETLEISTFTLMREYTSIFSTLSSFLLMIQSLSRIRSVIIHPQTVGWDRDAPDRLSQILVGACPLLEKFVYGCGDYWDNRHVVALARMAPFVSVLELTGTVTNIRNTGLTIALEAWSGTLTEMTFHFPLSELRHGSHDALGIDDVVTRMPRLRTLRLSTAFILPTGFLRGPPNLEHLEYTLWQGQFAELTEILQRPSTLPNLKTLSVWQFGNEGESVALDNNREDLMQLCDGRGLVLIP